MKILSVDQIRKADKYTIENEPVSSVDLMERAGKACVDFIKDIITKDHRVAVISGQGNNGGDGLVIARHLHNLGYKVRVFVIELNDKGSYDFEINLERLRKEKTVQIDIINKNPDGLLLNDVDIVIDALFGSGLARPVTGLPGEVIDHLNSSGSMVISVDSPSGLFADRYTDPNRGSIVEADITLSLELPKFSMVMPANYRYTGDVVIIPIGLHSGYIQELQVKNSLFSHDDASKIFTVRCRVSHKGDHGHGLLLSGSRGKVGAAILAAQGAVRSGAGLITLHLPYTFSVSVHASLPEVMVSCDEHPDYISVLPSLDGFTAIAIGPGIGKESLTGIVLRELLQKAECPLIIDADALNIISMEPELISFLPPGSVLTPHPKEFERLAGKSKNDFERLERAVEFSVKHNCYIVLKSAHTAVIDPEGYCTFNIEGNAGLAKGGSGDTLTGMILGLICRGYSSGDAARLAVFAHGAAANIVAENSGLDAIVASEVADTLGCVWKDLEESQY